MIIILTKVNSESALSYTYYKIMDMYMDVIDDIIGHSDDQLRAWFSFFKHSQLFGDCLLLHVLIWLSLLYIISIANWLLVNPCRNAASQELCPSPRSWSSECHMLSAICLFLFLLQMPQLLAVEGTLDNVKPSFNGDQGTTIKQLINSHMIRRHIICKVMSSG